MQKAFVSKPPHDAGATKHKCKIVKKMSDLHPLGFYFVKSPGRKDVFAATTCVVIQLADTILNSS